MTPLTGPEWWRAYAGGPYRFRGRDIATGIDCWGLYAHVMAADFGRPVNDFGALYAPDGAADPGNRRGLDAAASAVADNVSGWRKLPGQTLAAWEEGAGCLFRVRGRPLHCGVATGTRGVLLHAHAEAGVDLLDLRSNPKWMARLDGLYVPF